MTPHHRTASASRRPLSRSIAAFLALSALATASLTGFSLATGPAPAAQAAAGNPGTPAAPTVLYQEDFENGSGLIDLPNYTGDTGQKYSADPYWLNTSYCNGFTLSYQVTWPGTNYCYNAYNFNGSRVKAYALGLLNTPQDPTTNRALSTNTSDSTTQPENQIEFETQGQLNLPSANGRFVTFSVDAAANACTFDTTSPDNQPRLRFYFRNAAGVETPISNTAINPCTDPRSQTVSIPNVNADFPVYYGRYAADSSRLLQGSSVGIVMRNESSGNTRGNDGAIDNIRVLDVTPQLDKSFSPALVETGGTSTLTFTVTNTSELAAKNGWSFTDTFPTGLKVANAATVGGTCVGTTSATAGGNTVTVTNGQLTAGETSCTITVPVTSTTAASYTNGPGNVTEVGLNPPGNANVTFTNPSYRIQKSANSNAAIPGTPVKYSVTVTNTGDWAYDSTAPAGLQQASFTDNLSDVLDDATYNGDASDGATVTGNTLSWSGNLAKGQSRTITYTVTPNRPDRGNLVLNNVVTPTGPGGSCVTGGCTTSTPVQSLQISKTANRTTVVPGQKITYTVQVKNTGKVGYTTGANAASFTDDLSKVLDDANYNGDEAATAGTVSYSSPTLSWSGPVAAGATVTVTYSVTVKDPDTGDSQIDNAVTSTTPGNNCAAGSTDPSCTANIPSASYTVQKTVSAATVNPGDTLTYQVTLTNTGNVAYTNAAPASFTDDLSAVLDDASYSTGSATNGATVSGKTLNWSGALPVGQSVTVTYQVKIDTPDTGDKKVTNSVAPTGPGGGCVTAADCTTTTTVRSYTVHKSASVTSVTSGGQVQYTVTVTNTGTADYTAAAPASFTDDLSKVTDDATVDTPLPTGATLSADGDTLTWSGPLAVGTSRQIVYSVTVNSLDTGDKILTNAVAPTGPGGTCATPAGCSTTTPVQSYTVQKKASQATTTPGARLTYTVTVSNTGAAAYTTSDPASFTDDLSKVLDDATYNGDAVSSSNGADPGAVSFSSPKLSWTGPLAVGATVTVNYTVTVNSPDVGDHVLTNTVDPTGPGGTCTSAGVCTTTTPVQSITITKVANTTKVVPGERVTYTITAKNTGKVPYSAASPATLTDDLSQVLDDATYNGDAHASAGTVTYHRPTLSWSGPVPVGVTVAITYTVTVKSPDTGDKVLDNTVVSTVPGSSCLPSSSNPGCRSVIPAGSYTLTKTASTSTASQGSRITYTVAVKNTGRTAYTATRPASFQDNLTRVLDDATYNEDAKATSGTVLYTAPHLSWSGPLLVGQTVVVTYTVTVNTPDTGDRKIINAVTPTGPGGGCTPGGCQTTTNVPPGFAVHTGGTAITTPDPARWWAVLAGLSVAALLGCAVMWLRRRTDRI